MRKRLLGCLLIVGLVLGQMLSVGAAPSKEAEFDLTDDSKDDGYIIEETGEEYPDLPDGKKPVTPIVRIDKENDDPEQETYRVSFEVPFLTEGYLIEAYYFDEEENTWKVIEPVEIDYENKTVTFEFDSMDIRVFLVMDETAVESTPVGTSPKTGAGSNWMIWLGAAVVFAGAAVLLSKKKKTA